MWTTDAFDETVDAPMTIPGIRTKWETFVAFKSRIDMCEALECKRS